MIDFHNEIMHELRKLIFQLRVIEKSPQHFQALDMHVYPSEMNVIGVIGRSPEINVTQLSDQIGVTKGAISQIVKKMIEKGLLTKFKEEGNKKETLIRLTGKGEVVFRKHQSFHQSVDPIIKELLKYNSDEQNAGIVRFLKAMSKVSDDYIQQNDIV